MSKYNRFRWSSFSSKGSWMGLGGPKTVFTLHKGIGTSKYQPHQGVKEMERRRLRGK